ncbi:hypothetical protein CcrColossus_gp298 [Caulobacter phage CcrColossus]|uniref:Uncharacterized protein n=1 Tax=Caulobacter phage CcrColossus TaxID=1211640 RepID=K4JW91_9CAUD|nr:hypothetical protein CcrColossus_gp298 [Caulobacter phage CcrColossus]AFU88168.1 hypothetical protein CcrColossus_gp298 [Caulobacter phage CcrColossus]
MEVTINTLALATVTTGHGLVSDIEDIFVALEALWGSRPSVLHVTMAAQIAARHVQGALPDFPNEDDAEAFGTWPDCVDAYASYLIAKYGDTVTLSPIHQEPTYEDRPLEDLFEATYVENDVVVRAGNDLTFSIRPLQAGVMVDGVARNAEYPDTFQIPSEYERENLKLGAAVKVCIEVDAGGGERFWTDVVARLDDGDYLVKVDNYLVNSIYHGVRVNDILRVAPKHILTT